MAQQERGARTRRMILEAAATAFDESGYDRASTTEILQRSGLTRGALYHHFPSKEAIAEALIQLPAKALVIPERELHLQSAIDLSFDFAGRLQRDPVLRAGLRLAVEQTPTRLPHVYSYQEAENVVSGVLRRAQTSGELLPGLDAEEGAGFVVAAFTGLQLLSEAHSGRHDLMDRVSTMWRLLLPGLAVPGLLPRLRISPPT